MKTRLPRVSLRMWLAGGAIASWLIGMAGQPGAAWAGSPGGMIAGVAVDVAGGEAAIMLAPGPRAAVGHCGGHPDDSCWTVGSVVALSAAVAVAGRSASCNKTCRLSVDQLFLLRSGGSYEIQPGLAVFCPRGGGYALTNTGSVVAGARGKLKLIPDDLEGVEACVGNGAKFTSWVRPNRTNTKLVGKTALSGRVTQPTNVGTARISYRIELRHFGVPTGSGQPTPPKVKDCGNTIVLKCAL